MQCEQTIWGGTNEFNSLSFYNVRYDKIMDFIFAF